MRQKQKLELSPKPTVGQELDIIDMQSVCSGAHAKAADLFNKHKGNIKEIEKEVLEMEVPEEVINVKGFNYRDETLWAAKWLSSY